MVRFAESQSAAIQLFDLSLIEQVKGRSQRIRLYMHPIYGRVLVIGDELHHVEAWQGLYHEPLVHLPASFIPEIRNVLILGGGCLYAAQEVLKYETVRTVDLVEIDEEVLHLMHRNYDHADRVLKDVRLQIKIGDARHVSKRLKTRYDLLICDCIDFSAPVRGVSMYRKLQDLLTPNGVCSEVMYRSIFEKPSVQRTHQALKQCSNVRYGLITIPEYPGVLHVHALWGPNERLCDPGTAIANRQQKKHVKDGRLRLRFFDPAHRAYFLYMPPYVLEKVS